MDLKRFGGLHEGKMVLKEKMFDFDQAEWKEHAVCEGVYMKDLILGESTGSLFSKHMVYLKPGACIKAHRHDEEMELHEVVAGSGEIFSNGKSLKYYPRLQNLIEKDAPHEVHAGEDGLLLQALFAPALK